jgi:membrane-associated phospholipid phosphatase
VRLARLVFRLRPEEAAALVFLLPTSWLTLAAFFYAREAGVLGPRYPGGVVRLGVVLVLLVGLALALRRFPGSSLVHGLRETVPLLACFLIYTNLHDTIGFVNPHDVHHWLVAFDAMIFGVQPCVWAERFITPALTELMQFLYLNFFWIAPSVSLALLLQRRLAEFRAATVGIVACFFIGYALYVVFPAAPPRLVLVYEFTKNLRGYPVGFSNLSAQAFSLLPVDSRAAFPSLHTAASTLALVFAWRYSPSFRWAGVTWRWWFWTLLPFVLGLWASTIYLRHHYFVDLVAGWALAPVALWVAPRVDAWWARRQRELGYEPARGAASTPEIVQPTNRPDERRATRAHE